MKKIFLYFTLTFLFVTSAALACTDFRIKAKDGSVLVARTLEFALDLHSNLMSTPRNKIFATQTNDGKPGLSWKNQYGYVYLDGLNTGFVVDGMNEAGLSIEALYLPGETEYQAVPTGKEKQALPYLFFGDWILGNFKNVEEVKQSISSVFVFAQKIPQAKDAIFPLHFAITDKAGNSLVIEFVHGDSIVYDNILGILTNAPTFDWHITNLRNYVNLTPVTPKPVVDSGITFAVTGQGSGMLGLPGDVSPPSRFVKMAVMLKAVVVPADAVEALNTAQHVINNVDIPVGFVRESAKMDPATNESTQWTVFKDLSNHIFYYRTYKDTSLRSVDLSKVNFDPTAAQLKMPIDSKQFIEDMTQKFIGS